ncbi:J domain-containing protein [Candidatus Cardinium hertigii]|uniref:J domain-containing protein n=1 Tax=Candidatus Cardinium hertigii TaxID=247481 RepID=A0A3N2QC30_9BACT|nr:J domain-containing protein [Candidatus Cardinium hertigii]ROT47335.1 J domain-containing protein [Candidatus Cardinium hertigii]
MTNQNYRNRVLGTPFFYLSTIALVGCSKSVSKLTVENNYENNSAHVSTLLLDDKKDDSPWVVVDPNKLDVKKVAEQTKAIAEAAQEAAHIMEMYASEIDTDAICAQGVMVHTQYSATAWPSRLREILHTTSTDLKTVSASAVSISESLKKIAKIRKKAADKIAPLADMLMPKENKKFFKLNENIKRVIDLIAEIQVKERESIAAIKKELYAALSCYRIEETTMTDRVIAYVEEIAAMQNVAIDQTDGVLTYLRKLLQHACRMHLLMCIPGEDINTVPSAVKPMPYAQDGTVEVTMLKNRSGYLAKIKEILGECGTGLSQAAAHGMTMASTGLSYAASKGAAGIKYATPIAASAAKYAAVKGAQGVVYMAPIAASATKYAAVKGAKGLSYMAPIAASAAKYAAVKGGKGVVYIAPIAASAAKYAAVKGAKGVRHLYHHTQHLTSSYVHDASNYTSNHIEPSRNIAAKRMSQVEARRILGLGVDANQKAIRSAYYQLSLQWHPDKNNNSPVARSMFRLVNAAYRELQP